MISRRSAGRGGTRPSKRHSKEDCKADHYCPVCFDGIKITVHRVGMKVIEKPKQKQKDAIRGHHVAAAHLPPE